MNIYEKLTAIQNELKAPKKETNSFGGYKYRTIDGINEAVKPLLNKYKATLCLVDDIVLIGDRYYIKSTAELFDSDSEHGIPGTCVSVSAFAREPLTKKGTDESQITGASATYARKYALTGLLLLDNSEEDPDAEAYQKKIQKNTAKEEKKAKEDPARVAAYEDFKGICADNGLSAAAVARDFKLSGKSSADEFKVAIEGLTQLIETNQDLSKWRAN